MIAIFKKDVFKIVLISLIAILIDYLLIINNQYNPPAWDQGYHLSNVFKVSNILNFEDINIFNKFDRILDVTDNYRGPLTYIISSIILNIFGNKYLVAYLSNNIFNIITLFSLYILCRSYKINHVLIWASIIFTFSPLIISQRTDYLIDNSLTAFGIFFFSILTIWFKSKKKYSVFSLISGISYGLLFLVKPTGIILFIFPLTIVFFRKFRNTNKLYFLKETVSFLLPFLMVIYPWFSRHWITIISSIINAWNWGINYQDGLDSNSIDGWLYYFKQIPFAIGIQSFIFLICIAFFNLYKKDFKVNNKKINQMHIWFFSFLLNGYLILSLMSTKDPRFMMPLYPIISLYFGFLLSNKLKNKFDRNLKIFGLVFIIIINLYFNSENKLQNTKLYSEVTFNKLWPHEEVINYIKSKNPLINQTLAFLPDTKEINTFNFEAEAAKQGEYVSVRQVISNEENYKNDLSYFDWFLLKTGDQGIMSNKSKDLLNRYLLKNPSFEISKEWNLTDNEKIILMKRKFLNSHISSTDCIGKNPSLKIKQINNGLNFNIISQGKFINNGKLLIDFFDKKNKKELNFSLLNGKLHQNLKPNKCYQLNQNIPVTFEQDPNEKEYLINTRLIYNSGFKKLDSKSMIIKYDIPDKKNILYSNKISKVAYLGDLIKNGKFEELFNLVGILNQSDPNQNYLIDAEEIFLARYKKDKNISDLYSIFISQILQREINKADKTLDLILRKDILNGNAFLAKSIVEIYFLKIYEAKDSITKSKDLEKSNESREIIKTIDRFI